MKNFGTRIVSDEALVTFQFVFFKLKILICSVWILKIHAILLFIRHDFEGLFWVSIVQSSLFPPAMDFGPWKQREGDLMRTQRKNLLVDKSSAKSDRNLIGPNGYVVENSVCFRLKYIIYLMMSHSDPPYCYPSSPTYQTIKRGSHLDFPYSLVRFLHIKSAKKVIGKIK